MPDLQSDNSAAVIRLDRRYRPALMSFFLRRLHSQAEAEDLTQEVLTRLAAGRDTVMQHPDAYVFQVAANLLRDSKRRERVRSGYRESMTGVGADNTDVPGPERVLAARQSLNQVMAALQELSERTRAIFVLHRLEKLTKNQIADMFGLSLSGIDKHLVRAMNHLHARLKEEPWNRR